jgi:hypothetical protein
MALPTGTLAWDPLPGGRAHVVLFTNDGAPEWCGAIPHEWLTNVTDKSHTARVSMCAVGDCDHAGTHRAPRSVWTGEPAS